MSDHRKPIPSDGSTKPSHAIKLSKIRDAVLTMSARAPANDRSFDAIASINVMPNAVAPSAQEGKRLTYQTIDRFQA